MAEVLSLLYLHGLSIKDFLPALEEFFGASAVLSASVVTGLAKGFEEDLAAFLRRDLSGVDYVYRWADGMHFNVRLEDALLCALVMVGVRSDDTKELVGIAEIPGELGLLVAALARLPPPGDAGPGAGRGRRGARVLEGPARVFPETKDQRD